MPKTTLSHIAAVFWNYTQGTELRDPTVHGAAVCSARLLAWYTQGGSTARNR